MSVRMFFSSADTLRTFVEMGFVNMPVFGVTNSNSTLSRIPLTAKNRQSSADTLFPTISKNKTVLENSDLRKC